MISLIELRRHINEIRKPDPRREQIKLLSTGLANKFDVVLKGRPWVKGSVIGAFTDLFPDSANNSLPVTVNLIHDPHYYLDEYFCGLVYEKAGIGFHLRGTEPEVAPITEFSVLKSPNFGSEIKDPKDSKIRLLSLGHRIADILIGIDTHTPGILT